MYEFKRINTNESDWLEQMNQLGAQGWCIYHTIYMRLSNSSSTYTPVIIMARDTTT